MEPLSTESILAAMYATPPATQFAGFWVRLAATIIDMMIVSLGETLMEGIFDRLVALTGGYTSAREELVATIIIWIAIGIASFVYYTYFVSGPWQATPGKKLLGLKIVRSDGSRLDFKRATKRFFDYSWSFITLGIGFMMVGWTREKTGLHDLTADTRVIYARGGWHVPGES